MAHVPLILNSDKSKLSKRQGDVAVEDFLQKGYLKETLTNFIAFLGWNPGEGEEQEFFSMEELIKKFTLEKVQSSGAVFNIDKLNWMNNEYIKNYDPDKLTELALPYFSKAGIEISNTERIKKILSLVRVYLNKLEDIPDNISFLERKEIEPDNDNLKEILNSESSKKVFEKLSEKISILDELNPENYKTAVSEVQKDTGLKGKALFKPIRIALTGSENGPELPLIAEILGKDKVLDLLKRWF